LWSYCFFFAIILNAFGFYLLVVIWTLWLNKTSKGSLSKVVQQVWKYLYVNFRESSLNGCGVIDFFYNNTICTNTRIASFILWPMDLFYYMILLIFQSIVMINMVDFFFFSCILSICIFILFSYINNLISRLILD